MTFRNLAPPIGVALLILTAGTIVHGVITDRFGMVVSDKLTTFSARLNGVPQVIGDWQGADVDIPAEEIERANVTGYLSRIYTNKITGESVNVFLVCGTSRHITLHTPDLCYQAQGFDMEGEPRAFPLDAGLPEAMEFADGRFYKEQGQQVQRLRILWTFSSDGQWQGPRSARTALAGKGALYKLYLIGPPAKHDSRAAETAIENFARDAMPVIQNVLFGEPAEEGD